MIRRSAPALLCLAVLVVAARLSTATPLFRVDEGATRFAPRAERADVTLAFDNPAGRAFDARVTAELIDPDGGVRARVERDERVAPGRGSLALALPFRVASLRAAERSVLPWYRLRYRVEPREEEGAARAAEGVVSLSEITPDLFDLRVSAPSYAFEGMRFRARAHASHPSTRRPARGVSLEAELKLDDEAGTTLRAAGVTGAGGDAVLDFELPRRVADAGQVELVVRGRLGEVTQEVEDEADLRRDADVIVTTDKPIYQPGQTVRLRALMLDRLARRALGGAEATLKIEDQGGGLVFRTTLRASRFGVASADWPLAEHAPLGRYLARVEFESGPYEDGGGVEAFTVSRYELPTFAVTAEPDRKFYLPGEDAEISVRADYLFGRPVASARVRVVREAERQWNYEKQKWEVEEEETFQCEAGDDGLCRVRVPLAEAHADLDDEDYFRDLTFAAYVTDPTTNRTEQRRFALRLTREPIHVYVVETGWRHAAGFPVELYLSTFYADGTPAACDVAVAEVFEDGAGVARTLSSVRTNRYGLAKVPNLVPPGGPDDEPRLAFTARDAEGRTGRATKNFGLHEGTAVRIETDKTIHRQGEPVRVRLSSNRAEAVVVLDAAQNQRLVHTQTVRLSGGRADVVVPPSREFRDEVNLFARALPGPADDADDEESGDSHTVIFPRPGELRLDVRLDRREYRPGQEARADIRVRDSAGREVEGALGVVVTDRAVDERARTDAEFGAGHPRGEAVLYRLGEYDSIAGVTRRQLDRLEAARPPEGLDLLAEVMLNRSQPSGFETTAADFERDQSEVFKRFFAAQLRPLQEALDAAYERHGEYPRDEAALRRMLDAAGVSLDPLRDPWGLAYAPRFRVERESDVFELVTSAADRRRATADDFVALRLARPYFRPAAARIQRVVEDYFQREGRPLGDRETLRDELRREGLDLDSLSDPWGRPYDVRFEVGGRSLNVNFYSGGPDGRLGRPGERDDFRVWGVSVSYFEQAERRIRRALDSATRAAGFFPRDEREFREALGRAGIEPGALLDPWGRPYRLAFQQTLWGTGQTSVRVYPRGAEGAGVEAARSQAPRGRYTAVLSSLGPDGLPDTADDFRVADFMQLDEDRSLPAGPQAPPAAGAAGPGEVTGQVLDPSGAAIAGAVVRLMPRDGRAPLETRTGEQGRFRFENLAAGAYDLEMSAMGFVNFRLIELTVFAAHVTEATATLDVGMPAEAVTVTADGGHTLNAMASSPVVVEPGLRRTSFGADGVTARAPVETPRLREYFPETLVWQPLAETDPKGRASLRFKLADTLTTWKLSVVGSTAEGELGLAEAELNTFQPFFIEHDPPRVLTEGDEISLPVVVRNYLARPQEVDVELRPESWFAPLGPARKTTRVAAETSARETFDFRAVALVGEGRQRVSAVAADGSDAVEKTVSVRPDGEEVTQAETQLLGAGGGLELDFPAGTIAGTARAELKLYPNLSAHAVEGVEAIMQRPYGCGEQTVSSTYPSLLVLRHHRGRGALPAGARRAERYVREGYERLLTYRTPSGGFGYWSADSQPDVALTAYALRFLSDARAVINVDEEVVAGARRWLLQQAGEDGTWGAKTGAAGVDHYGAARLTAYVARALVGAGVVKEGRGGDATKAQSGDADSQTSAALQRALDFLARRGEASDDAYLLANFVLAADARGTHAGAASAAARRLLELRRDEGPQTFWDVRGETPFYGWGIAGRVETTALAARALHARASADATAGDVARRALLYLLRHKDGHGVWHSTQATVNVLDALAAVAASGAEGAGVAADVYVNGRRATTVTLLGEGGLSAPVTLDLTPHLRAPGRNRVELRLASGAGDAAAQIVSTHYVPWDSAARAAPPAGAPALKVGFDRTEAEAGQPVSCRVEAAPGEGRGMLLAEVGLPPGAEVDRASLERARADHTSALQRYEVLPDRVVLYLWSPAHTKAPARLEFAFRPRYGLRALTAPSRIYDYYNPEAGAVVPPVRFVVR